LLNRFHAAIIKGPLHIAVLASNVQDNSLMTGWLQMF